MAAPRRSSKRKQNAVTTTAAANKKRKALADRSVNAQSEPSPTKKPRAVAKAKGGEASSRRKNREDEETYDIYIQEKKDRSETLHPATYDEGRGGYMFTPKGKKAPVVFDGRRHKIVKKLKDESSTNKEASIKERLADAFDTDGEATGSDSDKENVPPAKRSGRALPTRKNAKRSKTAKKEVDFGSDDQDSEEEESRDEEDMKDKLFTQREVDLEESSDEEEEEEPIVATKHAAKRNDILDSSEEEHASDDESTVVIGRKRSGSVVTKKAPSKQRSTTRPAKNDNDMDSIESSSDEEVTTTRGKRRKKAETGTKGKRRTTSRAAPKSYKDEDSDVEEEEESTRPKRGCRAKSSPKGKPKRRAATRAPKSYNDDGTDATQSSSGDESEVDEAGTQKGKSAFEANDDVPLSKKFMDSFEGRDWRCENAKDY